VIQFSAGAWIFSLRHRVQTDSGAHPASCPMVTGLFFPGIKRPRREAGHSHPSIAKVKNAWSYTATPHTRLHSVVLN
jgi:hypothetical protein